MSLYNCKYEFSTDTKNNKTYQNCAIFVKKLVVNL